MNIPAYNFENIDKVYLSIFCSVGVEKQSIVFCSKATSCSCKIKCRNYESKMFLDCIKVGASRSTLVFLLSKSNSNPEVIVDKLLQDGFLE